MRGASMKKKMRIFTADSREGAVALACKYFELREEELNITVLREGQEGTSEWMVYAVDPAALQQDTSNLNSSFAILYEEEAVFFELYPAGGSGLPPEQKQITDYIQRKGPDGLDTEAVLHVIESGFGRTVIAPPQEEKRLDEDAAVTVSEDGMEAFIELLPPDEGGKLLTVGELSEILRAAGVVHGVSVIGLSGAIKERAYGRKYSAAKGSLPTNGADGELTYHFDTKKKTGLPTGSDTDAKVNYRILDMFEPVKAGQLLITRSLATPGKPGSTVLGKELLPKAGKEVNLPKTMNTRVNEDMTTVHSLHNGMIETRNGVITVLDTYTLDGDCDLSTGNIEFDGNVSISGAVISGMVVKATGDVTIGGVVNDAEIIAGGNVTLSRGMQGNDKGKVTAGGSIVAAFIERSDIRAALDVTSDVIMHSVVEAGRFLVLDGKRGNIVGGNARVGKEVRAKTVGGSSQVQTDISVGLVPAKITRMKFLKEELVKLRKEEEKIQQIEAFLAKSENMPAEKVASLTKSVVDTRAHTDKFLAEYTAELDKLQYESDHSVDGRVHCTVMAYPGTRISIGNATVRVYEDTRAATFVYSSGEVKFVSCQI